MKNIARHYAEFLTHPPSRFSGLVALLFFLISLVINFFACQYAYVSKGNPVPDILLDNIPVVDMSVAFVWGTVVFVIFLTLLLLVYPKKIPFTLKTMAVFIITRSFFVSLTHLGPSPLNTLPEPSDIGRAFTSGADLFFSGHTGFPFLFALIFWHNPKLRYFFIGSSILAGVGVLLGHIHYSIDVASAYFITYGIYIISEKWFKRDRELFFK